nr:probable beta-1,3-galactosyltransferase 14 [Ipomoea batatas]
MAALRREIAEYDDFVLLDIEEEYSKLPYKTLAFFKAAYALYDSEFYVKADDDIYLRPGCCFMKFIDDFFNARVFTSGYLFTFQASKFCFFFF